MDDVSPASRWLAFAMNSPDSTTSSDRTSQAADNRGSTNPRSVSVVVPTRNRSAALRRLLDSLERLEGTAPVDVIVVLGPSSDSTRDLVEGWEGRSHRFEPRVVRQTGGSGPGHARNLGLAEASGEIVAFTDDDCIVDPHWLEYLPRSISSEHRIVGVGGRVLPLNGDWISRYYTYYRILEPPPTLQYLVTANCAIIRRDALRVGGFDEQIPTPGGEDVALSIKLQLDGGRFKFEDRAIVTHEYRASIRDLVRTFINYGRGCREATDRLLRGGAT